MATLVEESTLLKWLWYSLACGTGTVWSARLTERFSFRVDNIFSAQREDFEAMPEIPKDKLEKLCNKDLTEARQILAYCSNYNIGILTPDHDQFPTRLKNIIDPPLVLYVRGHFPNLNDRLCISLVGTRTMTEYGQRVSYLLGHGLGKGGAVVVSGMAKGVDGMAHRGCIDGGGITIAVLGCGVDRCYPPEHQQLMSDIMKSGAVISEFPPFTKPLGKHFPIRNRLISGLSQATVVTEANETSGALITARTAIMQGRDIFAVPGKVGEENSKGVNLLLRYNAQIATEALDILTVYQPYYESINLRAVPVTSSPSKEYLSPIKRKWDEPKDRAHQSYDQYNAHIESVNLPSSATAAKQESKPERHSAPQTEKPKRALPPLSEREQTVYDAIPDHSGITADDLVALTHLSIKELLTTLTTLEIKGAVEALAGGCYQKI